jgi:hypothetical protein
MNAHRFDQLAKTRVAVGSRRSVIGGLLGGVLGLSRISAAGANHKTGHHCTPTDKHACDAPLTCREVSGEWTCQDICRAPGEPCTTDDDCCPINGLRNCILDLGVCDNDPGTD